ncbi:efflux RND transporter permease subunit [Falsibacillus albus]|uniref:Efflux RND transporter permease subunit n=1 Tax=Falsibacillus albus TaxID=2478915 RepID=A0A3L7K289_9BACI|nr:efflux RND transporter permease subunit [Falsibacillus albus]RLQ97123.1 efflux RND transporter permease subunit [Falsibacillus albus]
MKLSNFSIRRPVFTIVTMFLILILGTVSLLKIPLKLIPDINPPVGVVVASYPGASPAEVVEKVTKPLEQSLSTLPGIKKIRSTSQEGSNFILLEFSWSTSIDGIENDVLQRINQTPIPEDVEQPKFLKFDPSQFPIIQLSLRSETDEKDLKKLSEKLKQELTKVKGVANVNVSGSFVDQINVQLDQEKLKKYKLSQTDVVNTIQSNNISMPGDTVLTNGKELTTRVISSLHGTDDIKKLVLSINPLTGKKIRIEDVASVDLGNKDERTITRSNQKSSLLLSVLQESDANTADVSKEFQGQLARLLKEKRYEGIKSDILFDQGDYIQQAIGNIASSLIVGGLFAMLVLFLFLRNIKSPLIIGVAIPYSVIVTFVLMYFSHFALNIMTLGALALGIGMLVDNAIVVIENIYRHLSMGKDPKKASMDGAKEVGGAITASTLTTIAVFLPVVFITGLIGQLFTQFALTISFSLFASLIVALTVIPMLASRLLKTPKGDPEARRRRSKGMNLLDRSIRWSLNHRKTVLGLSTILLLAGTLCLTKVGMEFLPATDEGTFTIGVKLENGTSLSETNKVVQSIEGQLKKEKDVDVYVSLVGSTQEDAFRGSGSTNEAEIYIKMKPLSKRNRSVFKFVDDMKGKLKDAAAKVNPSSEITYNLQSSSGTSPQTLTFSVQDTDSKRLNNTVQKIYDSLEGTKDINDISTDQMERVKEIQIDIKRDEALKAGMAPVQIAKMVNDITRGKIATQIISNSSDVYGVFVKYDSKITRNLEQLKKLQLKKPDGQFIALNQLADITIGDGPVKIERIDQQNAVQFTIKYDSKTNLGSISNVVDNKIAQLNLPGETEITFSGDRQLLDDSIDDMLLAIGLAIVLVYIVMAAQFESYKYPFVIMFTVPLMIIGVGAALYATGTSISVSSIIGVIVLAGIVVNNAIVIVEYINQRKEEGMDSYEAIVLSVKDRARPILMTALTTILGLVPLALGIGEGTEINQPMGITVIGGLVSSTFLTLFIIPVVYSYFDKSLRKKYRWNRKSSSL